MAALWKVDHKMQKSRRSFITGLVALVSAPAIVRAANLMPVKMMREPSISMRSLLLYEPSDQAINRLDILYGQLRPWGEWVNREYLLEADGTGSLPRGTRERVIIPEFAFA